MKIPDKRELWEASVPMVLIRKVYDINSPDGAVQACLMAKRNAVHQNKGIGPLSCCSFVSYLDRNGHPQRVTGISRGGIPFIGKTGPQRKACAHGELTALWDVIDTYDGVPQRFLEMYIEMSPCPNCTSALNNILPHDQVVFYSYEYPSEKDAWETEAKKLCQ
jgi:deoxycytidylate deaminase